MEKTRAAGIRVIMITGDHPATAQAIARQCGIQADRVLTSADLETMDDAKLTEELREVNVFARVLPETKLRLVQSLQASGEVVAMTGDGVNDAPALKRSNVGIAMGLRGSSVAREAADIVLLDDNFATIIAAVEEGRSIYENIQKFIRFLFCTNLTEVAVIGIGTALSAVLGLRDEAGALLLPITAVQVLWINLVTDGLPALALALDANPGVMGQKPFLPSSPLLTPPTLRYIGWGAAIATSLSLGILGLASFGVLTQALAQTSVFHFLAIVQLLFVYPSRHTVLRPAGNRALLAAVLGGIVLQVALGTFDWSRAAFGLHPLGTTEWAMLVLPLVLAWGLAETANRLAWRNKA
jgi:Ca2+-transporting ATPase